jgi:hypothetical protein
MADEKRQLILDLLSRNKMTPGTDAAARDVDKLGSAADRASKQTEELSGVTVIAGKEAEKLGRSAEDTQRRINDLDDEIRKSTRELGELAIAFHEAGSQAEKLDISKAIRRTENDIRRTGKSKGILSDMLPDPGEIAQDGNKIGKSLAQSIGSGLALGKQYAIAGVLVLAASLAPELGAAIGGAIVGGVGAGGIIGGIALAASSDQQIKGYASRIGKNFLTTIQAEARGSFSTFIMEDLGKVEALSNRAAAALGKIFKNLAPELGPFVESLIRASDVLLGSFVDASSKAGKPLAALGNFIENVAIHLRSLIAVSTKYSDEGASALDFFGSAVTFVIDIVVDFVYWASKAVKVIHDVGDALGGARNWLEDHVGWLDLTKDGYEKGSKAAELYRQGLIGAKGSATDYTHFLAGAVDSTDKLRDAQNNEAKAARGQRDALKAVSDELRAQSDPAFALLSAQDNLREKQDALTEAVKKYGSRSKEAGSASRDLASAAIDLQGAAGSLSGSFTGELTPAMQATLEAAGLTAGQISAVRRQFQLAKGAGDAYAKTYRAKIITDYINRYSNVVTSAADKAYQDTKNSIKKRASGGPVARGEPYIVGENGPEVWVPTAAGKILSAAASRGLGHVGGTSMRSNRGSQALQLELVGEAEIVAFVRKLIRTANLLQLDPA